MRVNNNFLPILLVAAIISGCSSSNPPPTNSAPKNVAAASNGATVTSSFSGNESFVIDGDTSTGNFWSGGASGDEVNIEFDKPYSISEIVLYTNNRSVSISGGTASLGFRVFVSNDNVTFNEVAMYIGVNAPVTCSSNILSNTDGTIECVLATNLDARYIKVSVLSDFNSTELYEVEVTGS